MADGFSAPERQASNAVGGPAAAEDTPPLVSVIVPHFNDLTNLARCIRLLERQTYPRHRFEIVVADNNSRCGLDAVRSAAPKAIVVPAPIQGAGPARNAAAAAAQGTVLAFIDSDCFAEPEWLSAGVAALSRHDYVGGEVVTDIADPAAVSIAEAYEAVFAFNFKKYIERDKFSGTGNLFVPRTVFDATGVFRAGVSEDKEWCHRANARGFRLGFEPGAVVAHPARRTWGELAAKWRRVVAESWNYERERPWGRLRWAVRTVATAASPIVHAPRVLRSSRLQGASGKLKGLAGLLAVRLYRSALMARQPFV